MGKKKRVLEIVGPHFVLRYKGRCSSCEMYGKATNNRYVYGTLHEDIQVDPSDVEQFLRPVKGNGPANFEVVQRPKVEKQAKAKEAAAEEIVAPAAVAEEKPILPVSKPAAKKTTRK